VGHEVLTTTVLFDREIVRILNKHCVMCHVERGLSFPLETYEQTWLRRREIRTQVLARHMPPSAAVPGYGQFINDNALTLREKQFMVAWVEGLGPRTAGAVFLNVVDQNAAPRAEVRAQAHFGRWQLGQPDLTRRLPANTIEPRGNTIKRTVVDLGLSAERWVRGLEFMPGDPQLVRAAFFTVQETGQWLGSWTPWYGFTDLPEGLAYRLPAGSHVVAEIHYRGAKDRAVDQGALGLFFSDQPTPISPADLVLQADGQAQAGSETQRFHTSARLAADTTILALWPDIPAGIKSLEVSARKRDGETDILLFARDFSVDWPTSYILRKPVHLPIGTELSVTAYSETPIDASQTHGVRLTISRYSTDLVDLAPQKSTAKKSVEAPAPPPAASHVFRGKVANVDKDRRSLTVAGEDVPGWMGAMTMTYRPKNEEVLEQLHAGDQIIATVRDGDFGTLYDVQVTKK
jgi:Cu/Ag efflux protein CusF